MCIRDSSPPARTGSWTVSWRAPAPPQILSRSSTLSTGGGRALDVGHASATSSAPWRSAACLAP
eukprot:9236687-Alexandrium_andersonii.AAC.1